MRSIKPILEEWFDAIWWNNLSRLVFWNCSSGLKEFKTSKSKVCA